MAEEGIMKEESAPGEESGKRKWPKKPPKTEEDLVAIALLDALREGTGYEHPEKAPLACLVRVLEYADIPKAKEAYALVRVEGPRARPGTSPSTAGRSPSTTSPSSSPTTRRFPTTRVSTIPRSAPSSRRSTSSASAWT